MGGIFMNIKKLVNQPGICPNCQSRQMDYDIVCNEGDLCYYPYKCLDCGMEGEEWYRLSFVGHNVIDEDGEIIELN